VDVGDSIRDRGWGQGCLLDSRSARAFLHHDDDALDAVDYVLISHSCDVVSGDLDKEPFVEFIGRRQLNSVDGNFTFAKSPRVWHMSDATGGYELRTSSRCRMARQHLAELEPSGLLPDGQIRILRRWMANRYARAAFADEFNKRCRPALPNISKRLKKDGQHLSAIYLLVEEAELPAEKNYEVVIIGTMIENDHAIAEYRSACQEAINFVTEQLDGCAGVTVTDSELRSEAAVSLADLRQLSRWDYDSLSLRDESADLPATEDG
jgi:hypothetical protein